MLNGNVDEWPVSRFGRVICGLGGVGWAVGEERERILMKLQNGLIDLCGCMLQWRHAVKNDASRLVSAELLKDNESHRQET